MNTRIVDHQYSLGGDLIPVKKLVFETPISELRELAFTQHVGCSSCGVSRREKRMRKGYPTYATPWDDELEKDRYFCSDKCLDAFMDSASFGYRVCEGCSRCICQQNPSNGWHWQFRYLEDEGIEYCLRCYEGYILEHGQSPYDFQGDKMWGGMFFSYGNPELTLAGYHCVAHALIESTVGVLAYNTKARDYISRGYLVVTAFEGMAISGSEGRVKMYIKKGE